MLIYLVKCINTLNILDILYVFVLTNISVFYIVLNHIVSRDAIWIKSVIDSDLAFELPSVSIM